jgi:7,8-dihydroneopterin aldolase/epimerase/oxygenase
MNMDNVFIEGLTVETLVGIHARERRMLQPVVLSISLGWDPARRSADDAIGNAIDYAAVVDAVRIFVSARSDQLLETLAEACAAMLHRQFPAAQTLELRIDKPMAARDLGCTKVGVHIRRDFR